MTETTQETMTLTQHMAKARKTKKRETAEEKRRRPSNRVPIGIFSDGTVHGYDVGSAIADLLRPLRLSHEHRQTVRDMDKWTRETWDGADGAELLSDLWSALDDYLPEGTYAGSSEGDGACFGVWCHDPEEEPEFVETDAEAEEREIAERDDNLNEEE